MSPEADQKETQTPELGVEQLEKILVTWNDTYADYPREKTLPQLINDQAKRTPHKIAVAFEDRHLTYAQLDQRSNQLAHYLRQQGVEPETLIGLYIERSLEMVVGLLGILKAGGAYIPLDPDFPPGRLSLMLDDAQPPVLVTQESLLTRLDRDFYMPIALDADWPAIANQPTISPPANINPENLAYVMYTSGSTGKPKGVQISHRAVVNFVTSMACEPGIEPGDNLLALSTLSFDMSTLEMFLPLTSGAQMTVISREKAMDGMLLAEALQTAGITIMQATPSTWRMLLATGWDGKADLKILIGGEAVPLDLITTLLPRCGELWHMYGPTETTVWSTCCLLTDDRKPITIGRPIANTQIFILNENKEPVPVGVDGDLYIGGDGVARGYFNRLALNAERFVANPFVNSGVKGSRIIYKTGDRARYLEDGRLIFLGREDYQVKIRGFRIELGDIEAAVNRHPAVAHNVTIVREDIPGERRLVTYMIQQAGEHIPPAGELRGFLRDILPEYMLPARFVVLDQFPLTPNNKINRLALPAPDRTAAELNQIFVAPRNAMEIELATRFADILHLERVGIHDSFFDLGGNSLLAMRLVSHVREDYKIDLPLRQIFLEPTVAELSRFIEAERPKEAGGGKQFDDQAFDLPSPTSDDADLDILAQSNLTRNQFLMWMGQQMNVGIPLYNVVHAYTIAGPVDADKFRRAFQALLDHSDALRTVIIQEEDIPQQRVLESMSAVVELVDFSAEANPESAYRSWVEQRKTRQLFLDQQLFDTALIKLAADRYVWYLCQHHIVSDALSEDLVFKRVAAYYERADADRLADTTEPPQYARFIDYERGVRETNEFRQAITYWREKTKTPISPTEFFGKTPPEKSFRTERVTCALGSERSAKLKQIAGKSAFASSSTDLSLFTVFATLLFTTLHRLNGQKKLRIGTPFHGRPNMESMEIIGLFIEMGMLEVELSAEETFTSIGDKVMAETLTGLAHTQPGISSAQTNRSYDVILNFIQPSYTEFAGRPVTNEWIHTGYIDKDHNLRLQVTDFDGSGNFSVSFDMKTAVFSETERTWLVEHFLKVTDALIDDPGQAIGAFSLQSAEDRRRLLVEFNDSTAPYPQDQTVVQLFEDQVARTPEAVAVVRGQQSITYAELNELANELADYLRAQGVGPETVVALFMERSIEVLIAIWGTLKAGGAYLPIDPTYPAQRVAYMLGDAGPKLILTTGGVHPPQPAAGDLPPVIDITQDLGEWATTNPPTLAQPENIVYMIYTSGSTGMPKGTILTHQGLLNYAWWARDVYQAGEILDFPLYSSLSFDLTVTSIYVPLLSGGKIVIYSEADHPRGLEILSVFRDDAVDIVKLTPAHLNMVHELGITNQRIRKLIVGGEDFKTSLAQAIYDDFSGKVEIYNEYGPTEAVVGCMIHRFDPLKDTAVSVPIGTPAANARIYLLDAYDQPVAPGVIGEMVISSDGVARGYHDRPELTAERFGDDPFRPGARIYRTGDVARWNEQGQMIFLGRRDHQVKIRGARIELGEIEAAMLAHPQVETALIDVIQYQQPVQEIRHCVRCGLPSNYPNSKFDAQGICADCRAFDLYKESVARYFRTPQDLHDRLDGVKAAHNDQPYDALVLLSGGKDSTYMLYQIVREFGMRPLVFTLDNGFISADALDNIRRVCTDLDVDLKVATTPHMNTIFADSLQRHSNVCDGCFKTIYILSMNLARRLGIDTIITGLARGQLFETRLADTFRARLFDPDTIDDWILDARKAYHQIEDASTQYLDVKIFTNERLFDELHFIDFYRYVDVHLDDVYIYLDKQTVWQPPSDTGRSTNCLINDAGIYIHKKERGYHNYALPYSWDVRLGHKTREMAMHELDDDLNLEEVRRMLLEIGYDEDEKTAQRSEKRLAAYFVANAPLSSTDLRAHLAEHLPDYMIPSTFTELDALPLNANGKVDRQHLPDPDQGRPILDTQFAPPTDDRQRLLAKAWSEVFRLPKIGIYDNFFDLGGDSIISIQIVARARQAGLQFAPRDIFEHQTIADLAEVIVEYDKVTAEQGLVIGHVPLTPVQHWFFEQEFPDPHYWNQSVWLDLPVDLDIKAFTEAIQRLPDQHDALRLRFTPGADGWQQSLPKTTPLIPLHVFDLPVGNAAEREESMQFKSQELEAALNIETGPLMQCALFKREVGEPIRLFVTIHHLAIDGISWRPLLEDLELAYDQIRRDKPVMLPAKSSSFKDWAERLITWSKSAAAAAAVPVWQNGHLTDPILSKAPDNRFSGEPQTITVHLSAAETRALLHEVPTAYNTNINDALLSALTLAFVDQGAGDSFAVMLEGHGREEAIIDDMDLSRTIGWFTSHYPVYLKLLPGTDPGMALKSVKEQMRQIPDNGISYGLLRYLRSEPALLALPQPDILFNYMGQFERSLPSTGFFKLVKPLQAGLSLRNPQTHSLEINGYIQQDQLLVNWTFIPQRFAPNAMPEMASRFIDHLRAIIAHCLKVESTEFTRSDFDLIDLDDDQFGRLADLLGNL